MCRGVLLFALAVAVTALVAPASAVAQSGNVRAGVASVDASWHVGASAGQYASDGALVDHDNWTFDPTAHSVRRKISYGIQSRLSVRALVVEGPDGERVAILKNDLYIPQDLVYRRAGQLLEEEGECGITPESLTMAVTHNHSSPFYSSTSWGVWTFQDVFDVRFFNYMAERMFAAVERACDELVPVRVGASVNEFDKTHRHSFGPAVADDGTPAGYPRGDTDHDLTVIRFDDLSDPGHPRPLANLVNFSLHPEFLEGNDLISADYLGPLERMVDRETGATTMVTQGAVGTSEPERSEWHSVHERLEFSHRDYAQSELGARLMADSIADAWRDVRRRTPEDPDRFVPFDADFPVAMEDRWYPGPFSHPYPGVSSCRADPAFNGTPRLPIVGLPACQEVGVGLDELSDALGLPGAPEIFPGTDPGLNTDDFEALGIPVPENYSAPSYTGLEEDIDVHLQGIRLGEIYLPICSCEQWFDQSANIETRTNKVAGDEYLGYDWGARCSPNRDGTYAPDGSGSGTWTCPNPGDESASLPAVSDRHVKRMQAQPLNPANGWNDAENAAGAESEPTDPREIKGNYTHDDRCGPDPQTPGDGPCSQGEASGSAALGYTLTVPISMANDYNGYIATYREYQRGDHYRKALTGWGPHSSDYMASRLVHIGRWLRDPNVGLPRDQSQEELLAPKVEADLAVNDLRATALGETGAAAVAAYEAALPDDGGEAGALSQPEDIERFGAAFFNWNGGSNFTDNPHVRVERETADGWETYADQSGEVQVTLEFPALGEAPAYLAGDEEWKWTAHFEAFVSPFDTGRRQRATPASRYRFVIDGMRREGGVATPYHLRSEAFQVRPWSGIAVEDLRLERKRRISLRIGPLHSYEVTGDGGIGGVSGPAMKDEIGPIDYPDSYSSPAEFIRERRAFKRDPAAPGDPSRLEWFCFTCSFRPWVDAGDAERVDVTIIDAASGATETVPANKRGERWVTQRRLRPGERAVIRPGGVRDPYGDFNRARAGPLAG